MSKIICVVCGKKHEWLSPTWADWPFATQRIIDPLTGEVLAEPDERLTVRTIRAVGFDGYIAVSSHKPMCVNHEV